MNSSDISSIALAEIKKAFPTVQGVYLFGSFAKGEETKESDLDIAVLLEKSAGSVILWNIAQNIACKIQRDVDLIDLLAASTVFRFQIISAAKKIDNQNPKSCDSFEDLTWSMYLRFNEERKELLEDIKNRGRIY